jgi:hypothetical protein
MNYRCEKIGNGGNNYTSASSPIADNAIVRGDGGDKGVQGSIPIIDDGGILNLLAGALQDDTSSSPIPLSDGVNPALNTINKTLVGSLNEVKGEVDSLLGVGTITSKVDPALNAITVADVDDNIGVTITLAAPGNDQTLPNPTAANKWPFFAVINDDVSTNDIDIIGSSTQTLSPGETVEFAWDGTAWIAFSSGSVIWVDDGTDIKAAISTRNLDLQNGLLKIGGDNVLSKSGDVVNIAGIEIDRVFAVFKPSSGILTSVLPNAVDGGLRIQTFGFNSSDPFLQLVSTGNTSFWIGYDTSAGEVQIRHGGGTWSAATTSIKINPVTRAVTNIGITEQDGLSYRKGGQSTTYTSTGKSTGTTRGRYEITDSREYRVRLGTGLRIVLSATENTVSISPWNVLVARASGSEFGATPKFEIFKKLILTDDVVYKLYTDTFSDPPELTELNLKFGTPATVGAGFTADIDNGGTGANFYTVKSDGSNWWIFTGLKAVDPP